MSVISVEGFEVLNLTTIKPEKKKRKLPENSIISKFCTFLDVTSGKRAASEGTEVR